MRDAILRTCFIYFLLFPALLHGQEQQVKIITDTPGQTFSIPDSIVSGVLSAERGSMVSSLMQTWLVKDGFLDASVDSASIADGMVSIYVKEGRRYSLVNVSITYGENDTSPDSFIFPPNRFTGEPFTEDLISRISESILSDYEQLGYYLAEFRLASIKKDTIDATVQLGADIIPGERVRLQGVRFSGATRNSEEYLIRVAGLKAGDVMTPGLLARGRQNLVNSGLFEEVSDGELVFVDDTPFVLYDVEEQQLNFFDGLIGYQPGPSGSSAIVGYGDILLRNTIAAGNKIDLRYEQLQPLVSKLNLSIGQQFIGGLPVNIGAGLHFTQQDSSYLVRDFSLNGGYRVLPGFQINAHVRAERSSVTDSGPIAEAVDSRANFYGVGFHLQNVNRFRVPTSGFEARIILERGRRFINDQRFQTDTDRSFSQTILRSMVRGYLPLGDRQVLAPMVNVMFLESQEFLITDLFRFGGAESLRGFREDQFRGSAVIWGELEGRYMLERNSYIFLFGAYGYYERPKLLNEERNALAVNESLTSLGFGLAFESPLGIIKFSYAVSPNEDISNGNVHVALSTGL